MTVYVYPARDDPMGWIRLIWPAFHMPEYRDGKVKILMPNVKDRIMYDVAPDGSIEPHIPPDATTIVLQRVTDHTLVGAMIGWRKAGLNVVMDIDDDLQYISPAVNYNAWNLLNNSGPAVSWRNTEVAAQVASLVTCSTERLVQRYGHGHGVLIRNAVPSEYADYAMNSRHYAIGWTGSLGFRATDPGIVGGSLAQMQRDGAQIRIIGTDTEAAQKAFRLDNPPEATASVPLAYVPGEDYPSLVSQFGIGIAPLVQSNFNLAKSWLKPLQYAALGVPCVMSPAPDYEALRAEGVGLIAQSPDHWYRQMKRLYNDIVLWNELRQSGLAAAKLQTYSVRRNEWRHAWGV